MKRFTSRRLWNLVEKAPLMKLGAMMLAGLLAGTARAQTNFASAILLSGGYGSTNNSNVGVVPDTNFVGVAGFTPNAPLWYQWTAPYAGEVELDTIGSVNAKTGQLLDTVLAVYTGTSVTALNQLAANDDLYPVNSSLPGLLDNTGNSDPPYSITGSADYAWAAGPGSEPAFSYVQRFYGPSHLRFNATAGTTYYFAVDTKTGTGSLALNWAYQSSGVFRFASEDIDLWTSLPLYQAAQTESSYQVKYVPIGNSPLFTYYHYNVPGVLVTVTRTAGSTGRATVNYQTVDGNSLPFMPLPPFIVPGLSTNIAYVGAAANVDYKPVSGTLVFDDYEMSKNILIPILNPGPYGSGGTTNDAIFGVQLFSAELDGMESSSVAPPRVDPNFSLAMVKILNVNSDPYGPDYVPILVTNPPGSTNVMTNVIIAAYPTNPIVNFQKCNFRVPEDVNDTSNNPFGYTTPVTIYVERSPYATNHSAITVTYRVDNVINNDNAAGDNWNNWFPLQPASDYAIPSATPITPLVGNGSDFNMVASGSITFPSTGPDSTLQPISFTVTNYTLTKFNRDFKVELYQMISVGGQTVPASAGLVAETTVTILYNDQHPPAGSVDELYNADFNRTLALPPAIVPVTTPPNDPNPGAAGLVNSLVVLSNNETLIAGDFSSYNTALYNNGHPINGIVLVATNGTLDQSFSPNSGADDGPINAVALTSGNQYIIAGNFTSFNGVPCSHIARVNASGSLDTSFNASADGDITALAIQPDGRVMMGGAFQNVNGQTRNYLARLNTDGSLDTTFDPSNTLSGPVYAIALPSVLAVNFANSGSGESNQTVNLGVATSGTLTVNYNMFLVQPDDMRIFYGDTNIAAGTGVLIYDTGSVLGTGSFTIPIGPTGGLTTNLITIVMDQGAGASGNQWQYNGTFTFNGSGSGIMVGGNFSVTGQSYADIARFTTAGLLDTGFSPLSGADNPIYALGWQLDGNVVAGGAFTHFNGIPYNRLVRVDPYGNLDTANFFPGFGADDTVWNITLQPLDGTIYVGGQFRTFNGTHRAGFTRLYPNGTVDTTFLDTAYNQFAGLKRIYSWETPAVYASGIQSDGNVMIGGSFDQVGGGQANTNVCNSLDDELGITESFGDTNLWVEPKARDGVRNRSSIARLIGGSTPGPGSIGFQAASVSANKSQSVLAVGLVRTNGVLGPVSANFSIMPGTAQIGSDIAYNSTPPEFWIAWRYMTSVQTWLRSDGLFGVNGSLQDVFSILALTDALINNLSDVSVSIIKDPLTSGNLSAQFQLANPSGSDQFYLGGQDIPLGAALGPNTAPFTLIDDTKQSGTFGFVSTNYTATNTTATIALARSNGVYGTVTMRAATANGTAVSGTDYYGFTNLFISFGQGVVTNSFTVTNLANGLISTNFVEKTVNLRLYNLSGPADGHPTNGITNAVLRLINPNFPGYLSLSASNYGGSESAGFISCVVRRVAGSLGTLTVQYVTTNGTAVSGTDYIGATNTLQWNSGDASSRTVIIPLINTGVVGPNKQFAVRISNPQLNGTNWPTLFYSASSPGSITNATLTITNDNSYGVVQFSAPSYIVNENGGYATLTVTRTGGTAGPVSINYATANGANTVAGRNYQATNGVLVFAASQIAASFNVPVLNDGIQDPANFYFNVNLSNPTNTALGSPASAVVNIRDAQTYNWPPGSPDGTFTGGFNGDVLALALQTNGQILAGGSFTYADGTPDSGIARLNVNGSLDSSGFLSGLPGANGSVQAVVCQTDNRVLIGGTFTSVNGVNRSHIARLMTDGSLDTSFNPGPGADGPVYALAETFVNGVRRLYVGGGFNNISGTPSPNFARLNNDGSPDLFYGTGSGPNAAVYAVAAYPTNSVYAGKVLIGGAFTNINGFAFGYFARLNADGSADTNFNLNLGASAAVRAIALQTDGRILIGGDFTNVNGVALNSIARLNTDGSLDTNFTANVGVGANGTVQTIVVQADNRIVLGGQFTQANGVTRSRITRLLPNGAVDTSVNFGDGANGTVAAVVVQPADQKLVLGGAFTTFADQPHAYIVRVYGGSTTGSGQIQFASANYQALENGAQALITVQRTGGTAGPNPDGSGNIAVQFYTTNGTAVAGVNYTTVQTTLNFPPGEVFESVVVPVIDDGVITSNLTVNLAVTNVTAPAGIGAQPVAVLTIINVDSAVSFLNSTYTVAKNVVGGFAPIDVIRLGGTNGTCSVDFLTTTNGTGVAGVDYQPTNVTVTFNPGDSVQEVDVPIINNGIPEGNRTVIFALTNAVNTILYYPSNATLTIQDTVVAPGQLSFSATNYTAYQNDGNAYLTVVRTNGTSGSVSASYTLVPGTALPGVNYSTTGGSVSLGDGQTSALITIPLLQNNLVQGTVNLSAYLSNPSGGATLGTPTNTILNIVNPNVGFNFVTNNFVNGTNYVFVSETNTYASVLVQCLGTVTNTVQVHYSTTNGAALAGVNYLGVTNGTLTFTPGQTLQAILIPLIYDTNVTGNLGFNVWLYNASPGTLVVPPTNTTVVVLDANAGFSFTNSTATVMKNAGSLVVPVVCSNTNAPVLVDSNSVPYSVFYSTADGTAVANQDYVPVSGTLYYTNGIGTNTFTVPILNNSLVMGNRNFTVNLSSPNPYPTVQLVPPETQTITILDNNSGLSFSSPAYTVLKSGGAAAITVFRTDNTNQTSTVNFGTSDGTATAGLDYIATNGTFVFTNGVTSNTFYVTIINNTVVQPDKTVLLQLSNPNNGIIIAPSAATLTIHDNSGSYVVPAGAAFAPGGDPNGNGIIDPGERVTLLFGFRDAGGTNVADLKAMLLVTNGITSPSPAGLQDYGALAVNGPALYKPFTFTANGTNSQQIVATFQLSDGAKNIGTNGFSFTLGTWTATYSNTAPIIINDFAIATPYPSSIVISNVGGVVVKATVTVTNLSHQSLNDVDMLLVSPAALDTLLMSHVGTPGVAANHINLTFDDAATNSLPSSGAVTTGTNKPTAYPPSPIFP